MIKMPDKKIVAIIAVVVIVIAALAVVFVVNGHSLDIRDRHTRIVVTNSMDGDHHPDGCYHCDACDRDWLPNNIGSINKESAPSCTYCSSSNTRYVSHDYDIGKIPVNALIVTKDLSSNEKQSLNVGDVISFTYDGRETVHRIIQIQTDSEGKITSLITSGDNVYGTETSNLDVVHGVVVGESAFLGKIVHFAQSSTLFFIMMLVIIGVIISVIRDMYKMSQKGKNN